MAKMVMFDSINSFVVSFAGILHIDEEFTTPQIC